MTPLDHSYLNRFEIWLFRNCPRLFFDEVIRLIDQLCPEDRERIELVDTSGVHARAAKTYLTELIRTVCAKILQLLAQTDPDLHLALLGDLELLALFGRRDDKITTALKGTERGQRLQQATHQALRLSRAEPTFVSRPNAVTTVTTVTIGASAEELTAKRASLAMSSSAFTALTLKRPNFSTKPIWPNKVSRNG